MVSSAIWKKTRISESFEDYQKSTIAKDECYLRSLKKLTSTCFSKLHEKSCYYQLIIYMKKVVECVKKVTQCKLQYYLFFGTALP